MSEITAPAKIILLGEHAVVYGQPAIAIPISSLRVRAYAESAPRGSGLHISARDLDFILPVDARALLTDDVALVFPARLVLDQIKMPPPDLNITVRSAIPIASGLGSGAAISTVIARALFSALGYKPSNEVLNSLVYQAEKIHHGTPSGVDNTVIVYEKPVYFIRNQRLDFLHIQGQYSFLVADTGITALTRTSVSDVACLYQLEPKRWEIVFQNIGDLVCRARIALETGNHTELGLLMTQNHQLLQQLTVSSPELDTLVNAALNAGALGAKLSGGGRGGNMIALVTPETSSAVESALIEAKAVQVFKTVL